MSILIIIAQILAIVLAIAVILLLMTLLLPMGVVAYEINTDKKFRGALLFWGGLLKFAVAIPLETGWKKRVAQSIKSRYHSTVQSKQGSRKATTIVKKAWSALGTKKNKLPRGVWHQLYHTVRFEPWQGVITLGMENPAYTGMLFGLTQSLLATRAWSDLYTETDFVGRKSHFVGYGRVKIYPARIAFLAVKYAFKTLKLFR